MNQTENINELVSALSKAQGKMKPAVYNKVNPHFKNRYADLASCMDACRGPLSENGLSIMQYVEKIGENHFLVTMLAHTSGQWIKSFLPMQLKNGTCQALGAEMTYLKRYGVSAMIGIVSDEEQSGEDDGEGAMPIKTTKVESAPKISIDQAREIAELLETCHPSYIDKFMGFVQQKYGKKSLDVIPNSDFNGVIKYISQAIQMQTEEPK